MEEAFPRFVSDRLAPDSVLITCGLPATGKSIGAREVSRVLGLGIIATDALRREVLPGQDLFSEDVASDMEGRLKVYDEVFRRADRVVTGGAGVIIDATFLTRALRRRAAGIAAGNSRPFVIMETRCPENVSLAWIRTRRREEGESNAITEQAYLSNKASFEPVDPDDIKRSYPNLGILYFVVDTGIDPPGNWYVSGVIKK